MSEKYDMNSSKKAIILGVFSQTIFILMMTLGLKYVPSSVDLTHESMVTLFSINIRVSICSIFMFFVSNMCDIYLFNKLKQKFPDKLWLRNNVSTIISNCLENYIFSLMAFIRNI